MRTILHSDINNCYASIECLHHPELRGKCVAVGGLTEERHGIVLAKNQQAKAFGVRTGEPFWMAKEKCPELIVLPANFPLYVRYCNMVREIYGEYTDKVEPFGLDEAWLDVGGSRMIFGEGKQIAQEIRTRVKRELGITVSIGVSFNKSFAKLGSDMKKPDAVTIIDKNNYRDKVWPLDVGELLFVGKATARKLHGYGINTIGQLAMAQPEFMASVFGKNGIELLRSARGEDDTPVMGRADFSPLKSVSNSTTPPRDIKDGTDAAAVFGILGETVGRRLRKYGMKSALIQISIRDCDLAVFQHQQKLKRPTNSTVEITALARELFSQKYDWQRPVRSLGICAAALTGEDTSEQLSIYDDERRRIKREKIDRAADELCMRFGKRTVTYGTSLVSPGLISKSVNNPVVLPYTEATVNREGGKNV